MEKKRLSRNMVFTALFASVTAVCGFIAIPVPGTPIPIVLQNMMTVLSGMFLGPVLGTASTVLFLVVGILGLPVFSGGTGGIAKLMGPTGGFLIGYAIASLIAGLVAGRPQMGKKTLLARLIVAAVLGFVVMYIPGVIHFMRSLGKTFSETMALCVIPYIPGDVVKTVLCIILARTLRSSVASFVFGDGLDGKDEEK